MAHARNVRPGSVYLLTRRCSQRTFRLRPTGETNDILRFCLAWAAQKAGLLIHAAVFMSNHHHIVVTDVEARLPEFLREFHRVSARALNAAQGQKENLWSSERASAVELGDEETIVAELAYVVANPVEAGLVASPQDWPGVLIPPVNAETVTVVARPKAYFGPRSSAPESIALRVQPLRSIDRVLERVASVVRASIERVTARLHQEGRSFLGKAAILATSFLARATSFEPMWRKVPALAARARERHRAMIDGRREFLRAYSTALARWRQGEQTVEFPFGTWWMRVFHGVRVASASAST